MSNSDRAFLLTAYEQMLRIRRFETACIELSTEKEPRIAGSVHTCAGQEAVPVGALAALRADDQVVATYRGHGWALQSGIGAEELLAELCHRAAGVNGGRAGSALVMAPERRFLGENSIVGAGVPIACGAAMAAVSEGSDRVVIVTFGDGATSQGALHEGLVFAASRNLPVIFVCENNGWSEMTPISGIVKVDRLAKRAGGYGIRGVSIDGTNPLAVRDTVAMAAEEARKGGGPAFIECHVPRLWGHYNRDIEHYRPKDERLAAGRKDPIALLEASLVSDGVASADELAAIAARVTGEINAVIDTVTALEAPQTAEAARHVVALPAVPAATGEATETREITYLQAVNEALRAELTARPEVLLYGEDVGHAGGIFGATRYLQRDFGADRVFDTPIAESAILGSAVGAAMCGRRPVVEIMWADFMLVALDQLINQAANVRYVTQGKATAPLVVRVQQGATPGSCAQHSQCLEALLAHIPGLRVGLPATAQDAYSMLRAAIADSDPCIIIEARAFYQVKSQVTLGGPVEPVGKARLVREGRDVALVGWGTIMPHLIAAADELQRQGIDAAVLDLRWLSPLDKDSLVETVRGCGDRVVVAHEANLTGGFGGEVVARLQELRGAIQFRRVGTPDVRMPASPVLQRALLPNADTVVQAALDVMATARARAKEEA
ncbi:MAG: thiamine pyrophosphate-dependent enzyme [Pseudomonadota bacterium]